MGTLIAAPAEPRRTLFIQERVALATAERSQQYHDDMARTPWPWRCGGRCGTLFLSLEDFARRVGDPHKQVPRDQWRKYDQYDLLDGAGKISAIWYFDTPRGLVEVSDYWWNPPDQLSIRAADRRALRWFLRWAVIHRFPVNDRNGK